MLAREKPHCGISGVPFMKRTTGEDSTALSIARRVSSERRRRWRVAKRGERRGLCLGRMVECRACSWSSVLSVPLRYESWNSLRC